MADAVVQVLFVVWVGGAAVSGEIAVRFAGDFARKFSAKIADESPHGHWAFYFVFVLVNLMWPAMMARRVVLGHW